MSDQKFTNSVDAWNELKGSLSPSDVMSVYSALGFEAPSRNPAPNAAGWCQGYRLPNSIRRDKKPSVAINVMTGGFRDFGSDMTGDLITAAVEARGFHHFHEAVSWIYSCLSRPMPGPIRVHNVETKGRFEYWKKDVADLLAEHEYFDAEGTHVYTVKKYKGKGAWAGHKSYPPYAPGATKPGFPAGTEKVLYNLPAVLGSDEVVFLVEGEKDVDRLVSAGLVATSCMGGAGNWMPQYNDQLKGKRVCIIPDNDESGYDHMRIVIDNLTGYAADVCIVKLPGLGHSGDASDYLDDGGSVEEILDMVDFESLGPLKYQCQLASDQWIGDQLVWMSKQLCDPVTRQLPPEVVADICKTNEVIVQEARRRMFNQEVKRVTQDHIV